MSNFIINPYRYASAATDPSFANVSLLLHFDGSDGSTTFTDSSSNAHTVTAVANAQIDTAQSMFGGASGLFDGTLDRITIPTHSSFSGIGTGDFTVEFWARYNAGGVSHTFFDMGYTSASSLLLQTDSGASGSIKLKVWAAAVNIATESTGASTGVWYHYSVTRTGTTLKIFRDGTETASVTSSASFSNTSTIGIGARSSDGAAALNGWLDEMRVTKGVGRYTGSFTPSGPFPNS